MKLLLNTLWPVYTKQQPDYNQHLASRAANNGGGEPSSSTSTSHLPFSFALCLHQSDVINYKPSVILFLAFCIPPPFWFSHLLISFSGAAPRLLPTRPQGSPPSFVTDVQDSVSSSGNGNNLLSQTRPRREGLVRLATMRTLPEAQEANTNNNINK